jgi:hypothetical protein
MTVADRLDEIDIAVRRMGPEKFGECRLSAIPTPDEPGPDIESQKPKATPTRPPVEPFTVDPAMPPLT